MDGLWIDYRRPKSKKEVREAIANDIATLNRWHETMSDTPRPRMSVHVESTSMFGGFNGYAIDIDRDIHFVGPDPYKSRKFYGTITRDRNGKVVVK